MTTHQPQTARATLDRIQAGSRPWVAIGDLLERNIYGGDRIIARA